MATGQIDTVPAIGDFVEYEAIGGGEGHAPRSTTLGEVVEIFTADAYFHGHTVHASQDEPRVVIRNEHTGKDQAYYTQNIHRLLTEEDMGEEGHSRRRGRGQQAPKYEYQVGQMVEYTPIGGHADSNRRTRGVIEAIFDHDHEIHGHVVRASPDHPRYLIHNAHTGKETPYYPENIIRPVTEEGEKEGEE